MSAIGNLPFSIRESDGVMVDAAGQVVGDGVYGRGADAIARACNSHEALVTLLREAYADYSNPRFTDRHGFADRAKAILDTLKYP